MFFLATRSNTCHASQPNAVSEKMTLQNPLQTDGPGEASATLGPPPLRLRACRKKLSAETFLGRQTFRPKTFWAKEIFSRKNFQPKLFSQNFWFDRKYFWPKMFSAEKNWTETKFGRILLFWSTFSAEKQIGRFFFRLKKKQSRLLWECAVTCNR